MLPVRRRASASSGQPDAEAAGLVRYSQGLGAPISEERALASSWWPQQGLWVFSFEVVACIYVLVYTRGPGGDCRGGKEAKQRFLRGMPAFEPCQGQGCKTQAGWGRDWEDGIKCPFVKFAVDTNLGTSANTLQDNIRIWNTSISWDNGLN